MVWSKTLDYSLESPKAPDRLPSTRASPFLGLLSLLSAVCLLSILLCACGAPVTSPPCMPWMSPTPVVLPSWISNLYPGPEGTVIGPAGATLSASLNLSEIDGYRENFSLEDIQEQVELFVDGQLIPDVLLFEGMAPSVLDVVVNGFPVEPGEHRAHLRFHKPTGEALDYSWLFLYFPSEQSFPNLPHGIRSVRPLPDSILSMDEFMQGTVVPPQFSSAGIDSRGGICIELQPGMILGPGEYTGEEVAEHYGFVSLDGTLIENLTNYRIAMAHENGSGSIYDADGNVIGVYEGPHNAKCLYVALESGEHEVIVFVKGAQQGYFEFSWRFTLAECTKSP